MNCPHCQQVLPANYPAAYCPYCGDDFPKDFPIEQTAFRPSESIRRRKSEYGLAFWLLIICLGFCGLELLRSEIEIAEVREQIRAAGDVLWLLDATRDCALRSEPAEAVEYLYKLQGPMPGSPPVHNADSNIMELERKRAVKDVIRYLRAKTGKDLGDNPDSWIRKYGPEYLRHLQTNIFGTGTNY